MRTLVDNSHKTLENLKKEIVDIDEISDIIKEIGEEDWTIEDSRNDYPNEIEKLEEASFNYIGQNDLKLLRKEFPDKWKLITEKLAYPYEYFNSIDDYQKPVNNLKKDDFYSKLKNDYPDDKKWKEQRKLLKDSIIKMGKN